MNNRPPNSPDKKGFITWPIGLNLGLLLLLVVLSGGDVGVTSSGVLGLVVINGLAGLIIGISGGRVHYVLAFLLSCLALLLIGLGVCAVILSDLHGGMH